MNPIELASFSMRPGAPFVLPGMPVMNTNWVVGQEGVTRVVMVAPNVVQVTVNGADIIVSAEGLGKVAPKPVPKPDAPKETAHAMVGSSGDGRATQQQHGRGNQGNRR